MDKNSIIGFVLIAAIFIGFSFYQSNANRKYAAEMAQADSVALAQQAEMNIAEYEARKAAAEAALQSGEAVSATQAIFKDSLIEAAYNAEAQIFALENEKIRVEFSTKGAQPHSVQIKNYYNYDKSDLYILKEGQSEYSLSLYTGEYIRTKDFTFQLAELTDSSIVMRLPFASGGYLEQKYTLLADSYRVNNELSFVGMDSTIPRNVTMFDLDFNVTVPRMEKGYKNEAQYSKLDYYFEGDKKPEEIGKGRNGSERIDSKFSWFAFQQQFFSAIMRAPRQFSSGELAVNFLGEGDPDRNLMTCTAKLRSELDRGNVVTIPFEFYFGPNHYQTLAEEDHKYEKIIPLGGWLVGWFTRYAIIPMFNFLNKFIGNFGLIILIMTLVIKTVVLPLTYKSYSSSAKMAALKPELDKINAKYPNAQDQQQMLKKQQATMNLYKRAGASPMSGCLPTLLTFPILWAMFRFFPASIELRQESFLWCDDLSAYDSIIDFGTRIPLLGDHLSLFALLMAATMWLYSKITMSSQPNADDPSAASMRFMSLWMMPIMMFFICNSFSAALSYYYLLSQLIAMAQIWLIRRSIKPEDVLAKVRESEGKPMPKSKWQQRLEEAQRLQEQQLREQQKRNRR